MDKDVAGNAIPAYPTSMTEWINRMKPVMEFFGIKDTDRVREGLTILAALGVTAQDVERIGNLTFAAQATQDLFEGQLPEDLKLVAALSLSARAVFLGGRFEPKSGSQKVAVGPTVGKCHCGGDVSVELRRDDSNVVICFVCQADPSHEKCF
jgi:hypothetical protein